MAAVELLDLLLAADRTVAVAESLTGGAVCAALVAVPGASRTVRGGVVAYQTDLKARLLGVDADLLAARGAVDPDVAGAMASGVRDALGADVGLSTTGVAGPDPSDGQPVGTVFVAVAGRGAPVVRRLALPGSRDQVRSGAVTAVVELAESLLRSGRI